MNSGKLLRDLILGLSGISCGFACYLAALGWHRRHLGRRWMSVAMARVGYAIVCALVAEAVYRAPEIRSTWRAWVFMGGLVLSSIGFMITTWGERQAEARDDEGG